ncbi:hypothetical protein HN51_005527, partial [Arachis hypogaea]
MLKVKMYADCMSQPSRAVLIFCKMYGVALELNSHQIMLLLLWIVWWQGRMLLQEGTLMLLREKHIGKRLYIDLPDAKQRVQIFGVHSSGKQLAKDVDFEKLVFRTVGFSGADIKNLVNEAAIMMVSVEKKRLPAVHEVGHVVLAHLFPRFDWHAFSQLLPGGN